MRSRSSVSQARPTRSETRHRDHYTAMAALLDNPSGELHENRLAQAALEIDNLRAAFQWSRESDDVEHAMTLATSLPALWLARGRIREGVAALEIALADREKSEADVSPAVYARALADKAMLDSWIGTDSTQLAETALEIARGLDDPALLARTLTASGCVNGHNGFAAKPYFAEALELARAAGDAWRISQILGWQSYGANMMGDPATSRAAAEEGRDFAEEIGDSFVARQCRWSLGFAMMWHGELARAAEQLDEVAAEAEKTHDLFWWGMSCKRIEGICARVSRSHERSRDVPRKPSNPPPRFGPEFWWALPTPDCRCRPCPMVTSNGPTSFTDWPRRC